MSVIDFEARRAMARGRDTREVVLTDDIEAGIDEAVSALSDGGAELYQRGGLLVHVTSDAVVTEDGGKQVTRSPRLSPAGQARVAELLSSSAVWSRDGKSKRDGGGSDDAPKRLMPPPWLVRGLMERGEWPGLRRASGVTEVPVMRPDGTVLDVPGYDLATELIYRPNHEYSVPAVPSVDDALRARDVLLDVVHDFPFASNAHRAGWLACVLTPYAMRAFDGPAPVFAFDANTRGSGKSLLADVATRIASGRAVPREPPADDQAEDRKRITGHAMAGDRVIFVDNVRGVFGSPALESVATSCQWRDRVMGSNVTWEGEFRPLWVVTGNNLEFTGDMCRRICHVRIESDQENPEDRSNFKHPDLLRWVDLEMPRLVSAAVTLLRGYAVAGWPRQDVAPWGSFEGWVRHIASAVRWVGLPDASGARQDMIDAADDDKRCIAAFMVVVGEHAQWGFTVRDLLEDAKHNELLRETIYEFCPGRRGEMPDARMLGKRISKSKGRVIGGAKITPDGETRENSVKWRIVKSIT